MTNDLKKEENFRLGILLAAAAAAAAAAEPGVESLGWKEWRERSILRIADLVYKVLLKCKSTVCIDLR